MRPPATGRSLRIVVLSVADREMWAKYWPTIVTISETERKLYGKGRGRVSTLEEG
jgi:hypothetical protein